jgi:hypothetical protein
LHRDTSFSTLFPVVDGGGQAMYAQPLFVDGLGGQDLVVVATWDNNVYALDGATGATVWAANLGPPVWSSPPLPCGDIFPTGIIGTPVIDLPSRTIFADALVQLGANSYHHRIFALALDTGAVKSGWPVDVDSAARSGTISFVSTAQAQQGALALVDGTLYVPFGGLFGSCPTYYGWVVAAPIADPTSVSAWATTYTGAGIGAPGGISSDGTSLFVSTGASFAPSGSPPWGGGDAFLKLAPSPLTLSASFAPTNWYQIGLAGEDMGTAPIPFDLAGSTPSALALLFGQDGNAYLVDRQSPGGVGAALGGNAAACTPTNTTNACASLHVSSAEVGSAPALYATPAATYAAARGQCSGDGGVGDLFAVAIQPGSPPAVAKAWCSLQNGSGSSMVTTSDGHSDAIVWSIGAEGDGLLHAFDGDTGAAIPFTDDHLGLVGVTRDSTPIAAKGRIYVAVRSGVFAFKL